MTALELYNQLLHLDESVQVEAKRGTKVGKFNNKTI